MLKRILFGSLIASLCAANAQAFEIKGMTTATTPTNSHQAVQMRHSGMAKTTGSFKTVYLMKVNLSAKEKRTITAFNPQLEKTVGSTQSSLPASADVGMNGVPVLDQGSHGTCATFANTAAVDALLGKGDYVSQLCNLELGNYLEARSELPSGWNGSMGPVVLNQMTSFGIINIAKQKQGACAGIAEYPGANPNDTGKEVSLDDYRKSQEKIDNIYWEPVLSVTQRILNTYDHEYQAETVFQSVKKALATKLTQRQARITFGVLLPVQHCFAGACAKYHQVNDTWALTDAINYDVVNPEFGGHEMIITGYDDNATVIDNEGKSHKGIFTLRNSWGTDVGDQGNFYMTYDFFKKFVIEVQKVVMIEEGDDNNQR